jgi:hypothetical protein
VQIGKDAEKWGRRGFLYYYWVSLLLLLLLLLLIIVLTVESWGACF